MSNSEHHGTNRDELSESSPGLERIRRELARGTAELAVLALVEKRPRYGYELFKELEAAGRPMLEIKEGTLYPLLHRLEDAGYIVGEWQPVQQRARPRKYYSVTPLGRERARLLKAEWKRLAQAVQKLLVALEKEDGA